MTVIRALVTIPNILSVIPRDSSVNTFHFGSTAPATSAPSIHTALTAFYGAVDGLLSANAGSPATVKYYDLADAEPRVPILVDTIALTKAAGSGFPNEVAVAMSYRADIISGGNQARRRGRIYLGPIAAATGTSIGGDMRVTSGTRTTIGGAAQALAEASIASSIGWVVFSPTTAGPGPWDESSLDSAAAPVTAGWVDDAFDIIRSRGQAPTARSTWTAV